MFCFCIPFHENTGSWHIHCLDCILNIVMKEMKCFLQAGDNAIFQYFNKSLWEIISKEPENLWEEVEFFRNTKSKAKFFCEPVYKILMKRPGRIQLWLKNHTASLQIAKSRWNKQFNVTQFDCMLMATHKRIFRLGCSLVDLYFQKNLYCWIIYWNLPFDRIYKRNNWPLLCLVILLQNMSDILQGPSYTKEVSWSLRTTRSTWKTFPTGVL